MKKIFTIVDCSKRAVVVCLAVLCALMIKPEIGKAQTAASYVYTLSAAGNTFQTIMSATTLTTVANGNTDDGNNIITLPFPFVYAGSTYTQITVSTNGYVVLGNVSGLTGAGSTTPSLFTGTAGNPALSGWGRDGNLNNTNGGSLQHGSATGGLYAFQFNKLASVSNGSASSTTYVNFQIVLYGPSSSSPGRIDIIYGSSAGTLTTSSQIGIRDPAGTFINGLNGSTTNNSTASAWPGNGVRYTFTPPISTATINGSPFCQGSSVTIPFVATGTFNAGNIYTAQLSNNTGSFASPTNIGTLSSNSSGSLSISGTIPSSAVAGTGYRIRVVSSNPAFIGNNNGTDLIINAAPVVNSNPTPQSTCAGTSKTFTVALSAGTSPTYQWQYSPDNGVTPWANVTNGTPPNITYTNATTVTLIVAPSTAAVNGTYYYRCIVSVSGCAVPATSNSASLTVTAAPTTSTAGTDQTICSTTTSAILNANTPSVGVGTWSITSGPSTLLSQFSDIHNPAATFTPAVTTAGTYALVWTIANGTCSSADGVNIIVNAAPVINSNPAAQSTCAGTSKTFSVTLSAGTSPSYQWQYSPDNGVTPWANVANGTPTGFTYSANTVSNTNTLTVTPPANAANGTYYYRCIITVGGCSLLNSNSASLTVYATPTSTAGPDQTVSCGTLTTTLVATNPSVGTGVWSVVSGPTPYSFGNLNAYNSTFTGVPSNTYTLRWTVTNGSCAAATDDVIITFNYTLNGIYSVGAGTVTGESGHFATLTRAVNNYNACLNGSVTFVLTDATYSGAETFPIVIDNATASNSRTLTIKPNTSINSTISGSSNTAILEFNGADYITIDGSNNGSATQNLTITNTASDINQAVPIWIASASSTNGATNNTIKNCKINGSGSEGSWAGIVSGANTSIQSRAAAQNSNNIIQNCLIKSAYNGIYIDGATTYDLNWNITGNTINTIYSTGLAIGYASSSSISSNTISGINNNDFFAFYLDDAAGIALIDPVQNFSITNNSISAISSSVFVGISTVGIEVYSTAQNLTITNNTISGISNSTIGSLASGGIILYSALQTGSISNNIISSVSSSILVTLNTSGVSLYGGGQNFSLNNNTISGISGGAGPASIAIDLEGSITGTNYINRNNITNITQSGPYGAEGVFLAASTTSSVTTVYNNFISNIKGTGFNGTAYDDNGYGIMINSGGGYKIYYNTINLQSNQNSVSGSISAAINISSSVTAIGAIELRDNILANNQINGVAASNRYCIYNSRSNNNIFNGNIDYNDYYTTGTNLGFIGSNRATLANIITGFGGNANSVSISPVFVNAGIGDLHLDPASNSILDNLGTSITGITIDIDAQTRNPVTPDIGADEFNSCSPALVSWLGGTNNDWNTGSNWCAGFPPTISQNVIIPAGTTFQPVISLANANALSLTIASSASLTMSSTFNLSLGAGSIFTNNGTFTATANTGAVIFSGAGTVSGTSATTFKNITTGGALTLNTAPTITGNFQINSGAVTVTSPTYTNTSSLIYNISGAYTTGLEWNAGGSGTITPGSSVPQNVLVQSGTITIPNSGGTNRALAGNLTINSGTVLQMTAGSRDLYVAGNWINSGGTFNANSRRVTFDGASGTQTVSGNTTFFDLSLNNSGVTTDFSNSTITMNDEFRVTAGTMNGNTSAFIFTTGTTTIEGGGAKFFYNVQINPGAVLSDLTASAGNSHIANSFVNNGTFNQNNTHVTFFDKSGAVNETMSGAGATTFGKLTIGDGSGLSSATTLNCTSDFTVTGGNFTFFNGSIFNGNNNTATFSANAATVSGNGSANFYNAITNVALNLGASPTASKISNNLQINTAGSIITNAPFYNSAATLIYNTTNPTYNTNIEWTNNTNATGSGAPYNVTIQNTNSVVIAGDRTVPGTLNLTAGNLDIGTNHTLTVNSGFTGIGGNLKGSTTSNLVAGGTGTINFNAAANYLKNLNINNSANLTLGSALNITASNGSINSFGTVTVNSGATLDAAGTGYLTIKSDVYGDARVGSSAGTLNGNVTVERYVPARRAWRFLGVPFNSSSQSINAGWQEGQALSTLNCPTGDPTPAGLGTEITNNNTGNGYDQNITTNPSLKVWTNNAWTTPTSTLSTNIVLPYRAYCLFIRGDRQICLVNGTAAGSGTTTLRAKGILNQVNGNPVSIGFSGANVNDFIFVTNPYASAIDLSKTGYTPSNANPNFFYVWDPKIGGSSGVGAYVVYSFASGTWSDNSGSYSSTNLPVLQSGQAFMVQATGTSGSVGFTENNKTITEFNVNGRRAPAPVLFAQLALPSDSLKTADGVAVTFDSRFSKGLDEFDAPKNWNFIENMALQRGANYFAVEAMPLPQLTDTIFFKLYLKQQPYALRILSQNLPGNIRAWLVDKYLNTKTEVNLEDTTLYNFTPNPDTNSYRNRFMLVFNRQLQTTPVPVTKITNQADPNITGIANNTAPGAGSITIAPNPVVTAKNALLRFNNITKGLYEIAVYNAKGQKLGSLKIQHDGSNTVYHLPSDASWSAGVYAVVVLNQATKESKTLKLIIGH